MHEHRENIKNKIKRDYLIGANMAARRATRFKLCLHIHGTACRRHMNMVQWREREKKMLYIFQRLARGLKKTHGEGMR